MKVNDYVKYFSIRGQKGFEIFKITSVHPNGIPSYRYPMVMLNGNAGAVAQSHCEKINLDDFSVKDGIIYDCSCDGCYCCTTSAPCGHCTNHSVGEV